MRNVGVYSMSAGDKPVVSIDFSDLLGNGTIVGTPEVTGVNCTATYLTHDNGVVAAQVTDVTDEYSGSVQIRVTLSDPSPEGRSPGREVSLRFL